MNIKQILGMTLVAASLLSACSALVEAGDLSGQPTETVSTPSGYTPATVDGVDVEFGVGSPIPVLAIITGTLPDTCAQVELDRMDQEGATFDLALSTIGSTKVDCIKDEIPFILRLPLNVISLPAGTYTVEVHGVSDTSELDTGNTSPLLPGGGGFTGDG